MSDRPLRSAASVQEFVLQPVCLEALSLTSRDLMMASDGSDIVEKRMYGNEPSVHSADSFHEHSEASVQRAALKKATRKMRIHNARTAFTDQAVLILFPQHGGKRVDLGAFGYGKPILDIGTIRIVIGHEGTGLEGVDIAQRKVAYVCNFLSAEISPKQRTVLNMPLMHIVCAQMKGVIEDLCKPG